MSTAVVPTQTLCASCGEPIFWLKHHRTKRLAPIEAKHSPDGNVLTDVRNGRYTIATAIERATYREHLHLNHFVTCPQREIYRKQGSRSDSASAKPKAQPAAKPSSRSKRAKPVLTTSHVLMAAWREAAERYTALGSGPAAAACRAARAAYYTAVLGYVPPIAPRPAIELRSEYVPWWPSRGEPCPYRQGDLFA